MSWPVCATQLPEIQLPEVQLPSKLSGQNVLVLYKLGDGLSKKIAQYYAAQRKVPLAQLVAVSILGNPAQINKDKFAAIYDQISPHLTADIKVILLTWNSPYRVECMSITSAFALGFDVRYCSHQTKEDKGCHTTANSPYFNANSSMLWQQESQIRLSMMLSGKTFQQAKTLIDRGLKADNSYPSGTAYLVRTHDGARSTRWPIFKSFSEIWGRKKGIDVRYIDDRKNYNATQIRNKKNIMFYQTGLSHVPAIKTNHYLPGAIADHLTSGGGIGINLSGQMKAFRWLEAGATGSYGTVIEPCNYPEKFPNPQILIPAYIDGDTLIEAYWKSVQQPGEGLFIGEPLARPWSKTQLLVRDNILVIRSHELNSEKSYLIEAQTTAIPDWHPIEATIYWKGQQVEIHIPLTNANARRYRIVETI